MLGDIRCLLTVIWEVFYHKYRLTTSIDQIFTLDRIEPNSCIKISSFVLFTSLSVGLFAEIELV